MRGILTQAHPSWMRAYDGKEVGERKTYHEYTSSLGGNTFLPACTSRSRNFLSSRNSGEVISSFSRASQLSWSVSISSFSMRFCSSVSLATHFALSKFEADASPADDLLPFALGAAKNEVSVPCCLAFLASFSGKLPAFRFSDDIMDGVPEVKTRGVERSRAIRRRQTDGRKERARAGRGRGGGAARAGRGARAGGRAGGGGGREGF